MKNKQAILVLFFALFSLFFAACGAAEPASFAVILCIGDGMGPGQEKAASYYLSGREGALSFHDFPVQTEISTFSANSSVTDSAASATAIATGEKVNNGVISLKIPGDGSEIETILEYYQKQGKAVGLVTTAFITHATPAAFAAHVSSRGNYTEIGEDYFSKTLPHVLFGGGGNGVTSSTA